MSHETQIDEPVKVWAFFDPSTYSTSSMQASSGQVRLFPFAMTWQRRLIKFKKLIFISTLKTGETRLVNLICASETANFELEYNTSNFLWKVKKVMPQ